MLKAAQANATKLKTDGESVAGEYDKLRIRFSDTAAIAAQLEALSKLVDVIGEKLGFTTQDKRALPQAWAGAVNPVVSSTALEAVDDDPSLAARLRHRLFDRPPREPRGGESGRARHRDAMGCSPDARQQEDHGPQRRAAGDEPSPLMRAGGGEKPHGGQGGRRAHGRSSAAAPLGRGGFGVTEVLDELGGPRLAQEPLPIQRPFLPHQALAGDQHLAGRRAVDSGIVALADNAHGPAAQLVA